MSLGAKGLMVQGLLGGIIVQCTNCDPEDATFHSLRIPLLQHPTAVFWSIRSVMGILFRIATELGVAQGSQPTVHFVTQALAFNSNFNGGPLLCFSVLVKCSNV